MTMRIGFSRREITPPLGVELGGYAGYRPCGGVHDPLWCKAVVLEDRGRKYALVAMDLLSVDESLAQATARALEPLGICGAVVSAIHTHASPCGIVPGEGPLARVNRVGDSNPELFLEYTDSLINAAVAACRKAAEQLETFRVRVGRGVAPIIGSERHTGENPELTMTALECRTDSGRKLILWQIPCHPTVMGPGNLLASADFAGGVEALLDADMAVFLNGAAGDISTRFTRREQTFDECARVGAIAAEAVRFLLETAEFSDPGAFRVKTAAVTLKCRPVEDPLKAQKTLDEAVERWQAAEDADPMAKRLLRSLVEGAGVSLEFSHTLAGTTELSLPVTVFSFAGMKFVTVPGELYSTLWRCDAVPICYANGYYRYIAGADAYDAGHYEAMAAILARGQGEVFVKELEKLLNLI